MKNLFKLNTIKPYIIDNDKIINFVFFIHYDTDISIEFNKLLISINDNIKKIYSIGYNNIVYNHKYIIDLYYLYGSHHINLDILKLRFFYKDYLIDDNQRSYNRYIYMLCYSYYYGQMGNNDGKSNILSKLEKNFIFHNKSVLLISKLITGYGGVQKTSMQIIKLLDKKYNISILSNKYIDIYNSNENINNKTYFNLNNEVHNSLILKLDDINSIKKHVDNSDYKFIINNKLNSITNIQFNKKIIYIVHNSMDPINKMILNKKENINKVLTINNFNRKLLIENGFTNVKLFRNYIEVENKEMIYRKKFNYSIAFIGRISREKNVQLLIDTILLYNNYNDKKIKLYILGDGSEKLKNTNNSNIQLLGRISFDEIKEIYKKIDYVISSSLTEGKPFSVLEAMSYGIPCIHSNINGIDELIKNNDNGFLFDLVGYDTFKYNMSFDNLQDLGNNDEDLINLNQVITKAYSIDIHDWNRFSNKCIGMTNKVEFSRKSCEQNNMYEFEN